jgi:hypothetical protein
MRKLTAVCFALLISVSAAAAPNDSSDRPNPIARIVRNIKSTIIRALDLAQPGVPVPSDPTHQ